MSAPKAGTVTEVTTELVGEVVDALPALATPDPTNTSESWLAIASTVTPALLVIFHFQVDGTVKAALVTVLGGVLAAFSLWHAKGVRSARALAKGISTGNATGTVIKP